MERESGSGKLCKRGCGFYGSPATRNLCSKCYRDYLKERGNSGVVLNTSPNSTAQFNKYSMDETSAALNIGSIQSNEKKKRCLNCNKKVGILGFRCRCGGTFCGVHRYPETHKCKIDYKSAGRTAIAEQNLFAKPDKLTDRI